MAVYNIVFGEWQENVAMSYFKKQEENKTHNKAMHLAFFPKRSGGKKQVIFMLYYSLKCLIVY